MTHHQSNLGDDIGDVMEKAKGYVRATIARITGWGWFIPSDKIQG